MRVLVNVRIPARILNSSNIPIGIPARFRIVGSIPATITTPARITTSIRVSTGDKIV